MRILTVFFFLYLAGLHAIGRNLYHKRNIRIENARIALTFDGNTGTLIQLINKNTGDNYLKTPSGGNLFRLYMNTNKMAGLSAGPHNDPNGGYIIEAKDCFLKKHAVEQKDNITMLYLHIGAPDTLLHIEVKIVLEHDRDYFDCYLRTHNSGNTTGNVYASFPYFSGVSLGSRPETNLAVNMWDRGYPGIKAWQKNSGGVYGRDVSMQWQCAYEPSVDEGLAFIAMDTAFGNKILTCFPGGGMQALYFDRKDLRPGGSMEWPAARVAVFSGNWRKAAKLYKQWCDHYLTPRPVPQWYKNDVAIRSSAWIPNKEAVEQAKRNGNSNGFTSFRQLLNLYKGGYADCIEMAMWNEGVNLWPETYGPWMSSGFLDFRSDLGGRVAFEEGVKRVHQFGRKVAMYVAGYGIRTTSPLFKNDDWKNWAIVDNEKGEINFGYRGEKDTGIYGIFNCLGYKPWQDNIIRICTMLAKAGVDEIRLDEIGFPFKPCFNKAHHHNSPYDSHQWTREFLRRIREATDQINPDLVISTEFFMDYFHTCTNGALVMDCNGPELDAMKVALPDYMAMSYHAGAAEAIISGAIMSKTTAYRQDWAWAHVGIERPADYPSGPGISLPFYELYPSFADAFIHANPTERDPFAPADPKWAGHLWKADQYWILTGGHEDLTPLPSGEVEVLLPELPDTFRYAYAFDMTTLAMTPVKIERSDNKIAIRLRHSLNLVFFPSPVCPPLPMIEKITRRKKGQALAVSAKLFAPWNVAMLSKSSQTFQLNAPGFGVRRKNNGNAGFSFDIDISSGIEPNNYFLQVTGNCLPLKKWFAIE
ncbi:MAG: DUF6259 domain-containing protein [Agriterribacter sp.]